MSTALARHEWFVVGRTRVYCDGVNCIPIAFAFDETHALVAIGDFCLFLSNFLEMLCCRPGDRTNECEKHFKSL